MTRSGSAGTVSGQLAGRVSSSSQLQKSAPSCAAESAPRRQPPQVSFGLVGGVSPPSSGALVSEPHAEVPANRLGDSSGTSPSPKPRATTTEPQRRFPRRRGSRVAADVSEGGELEARSSAPAEIHPTEWLRALSLLKQERRDEPPCPTASTTCLKPTARAETPRRWTRFWRSASRRRPRHQPRRRPPPAQRAPHIGQFK